MRKLIYILAPLALASCGKLGDFDRLSKSGYTTVNIGSPQKALAGTPQNGGVMVYAVRQDLPQRRASRFLLDDSKVLSWPLPNGAYRFFALGYEQTELNASSNFHRCGKSQPVFLNGTPLDISIPLSKSNCADSLDFQLPNSFDTATGQARPFLLVSCAGGGGDMAKITTSNGQNVCDGGAWFDNNVTRLVVNSADESVYVSGSFTTYDGVAVPNMVKLTKDGVIDSTFSVGSGFTGTPSTLLLDSNGKLLVAGAFTAINGTGINRIARLSSDGSIDTTFTVGTGFNSTVSAMVLQTDGKIVAAGSFTSYNGTSINMIARLNTDGTLDTSFNPGTGPNSAISKIDIASTGKLVIGGGFTTYNGSTANRIARINSDGTFDSSFSTGTGLNAAPSALAVDSSDAVWLSGSFTQYNSITVGNLIRVTSSGARDTNSNIASTGTAASVILPLSDGKVILGGSFTTYNGATVNFGIMRLNTNFTADSTFNSGGSGAGSATGALTISRSSGSGFFVMGGNFSTYNSRGFGRIIRLNTGGSIDTHFASSRPQPSSHVGSFKISLVEYDMLDGFLKFTEPRINSSCVTISSQGAHTTTDIKIPTGTPETPAFAMQVQTYGDSTCAGTNFESLYTLAGGQVGVKNAPNSTFFRNTIPSPADVTFSPTYFQQLFDSSYHWLFLRELQ